MEVPKTNKIKPWVYVAVLVMNAIYIVLFYFLMKTFS